MTTTEKQAVLANTIKFASAYCGVIPSENIVKKIRKREYVKPRHLYYYLMRRYWFGRISGTESAAYIGQDHATGLHGAKVIGQMAEVSTRERVWLETACAKYEQIKDSGVSGFDEYIEMHRCWQKVSKFLPKGSLSVVQHIFNSAMWVKGAEINQTLKAAGVSSKSLPLLSTVMDKYYP